MTTPSIPRARRFAGAVLLFAGLGLSAVTVLPATTVAAAQTPAAQDVVGLRKGARGDAVKALQQALVRVGIGVKYGVDSYFGSATEASVKAFQRLNGLAMTGVVDRATAAGLGLVSAATPAPAAAAAASPATGLVGLGSTGPLVTQVQQALINFGWPITSGADGVFGASTERALKAFQKANGLGVSGRTYPATLRVLGVSATSAPAAPTAAATPAPATSVVGLQFGARGPAVTELQKAIIAFGWPLRGGADGIFGTSTQAALRKVQSANGITASGTVDDATARLLGLAGGSAAPAATGSTANGFAAYNERGARVVALQQALINAGIAVRGGADGIFGSGTASAVMAFQRAKGLTASGKVDEATAAALGLAAAPATAAAAPQVDIRLEAKPVQGPCYYGDTWNAARGSGRAHLGTDILAAEGSPLFAVVTGKVIQIYNADAPLSGNGIKIARADGTYFFYAHLSALAPEMSVGAQVSAGQVIGYVGRTGNAATPHLHFEVHPLGGAAINPYPIIKAFGAC